MGKIILTGDRPTGRLHIGHYVGSLRRRVELQNSGEYEKIFIMIADAQALTDNVDNPEKSNILIQSELSELTELTFYYMNMVTVSRLQRNPTVKSEIQMRNFEASIPVGFFCYPISQAADITAFKATTVPVGEDQLPMIEQAQEIVHKFNATYKEEVLVRPEALLPGNEVCSRLPGTPADVIKKKVMGMFTDPNHLRVEDPGSLEGNTVFTYLDAFCKPEHFEMFGDEHKSLDEMKEHYQRGGLGDVKVKKFLINVLEDELAPIRARREELQKDRMIEVSKFIPEYKYIPVITGPTASGKSSLALELCRRTGGELISADSMQIYKGLDIGTAKDSAAERAEIPHHMTDIAEPGTYFNVSDYVTACYETIGGLLARGVLPVICGGTGQYISALYYGFDYGRDASADEETARLEKEFEENGIDGIYARLKERDPEAAAKIHPNNTRRVIRALAVIESTGRTFTEKNSESTSEGPRYPFKLFMIDMDRQILYDRINRRVDIMMEEGIEQEARDLYDSDADKKSTCFQAIGYKEFKDYFEGKSDIDEAVYNIKLRSRHYAKRQLTWFRAIGDDVIRLSPDDSGKNVQKVLDTISQ